MRLGVMSRCKALAAWATSLVPQRYRHHDTTTVVGSLAGGYRDATSQVRERRNLKDPFHQLEARAGEIA
jgi:hypothetical protein